MAQKTRLANTEVPIRSTLLSHYLAQESCDLLLEHIEVSLEFFELAPGCLCSLFGYVKVFNTLLYLQTQEGDRFVPRF